MQSTAYSIVVDENTNFDQVDLLPFIYELPKEFKEEKIENIIKEEFAYNFKQSQAKSLFKIENAPTNIWLSFSIISNFENDIHINLVTEILDLYQSDLYHVKNNKVLHWQTIGHNIAFSQLDSTIANYDFPITLTPGENQFYLNIEVTEADSFPIYLTTSKKIAAKQNLKFLLVGIGSAFTVLILFASVWLKFQKTNIIPKSTFFLLLAILCLQISNANIFNLIFQCSANIDILLRHFFGVIYISTLASFSLYTTRKIAKLNKILGYFTISTSLVYSYLLFTTDYIENLLTLSLCLFYLVVIIYSFLKQKQLELRSSQFSLILFSLTITIIFVYALANFNFFGSSWTVFVTSQLLITLAPFIVILILIHTYKESMNEENPSRNAVNSQHWPLLRKINHDLRSPINAVLGMSELLQDMQLSVNQQNYINTIQTAGFQLLSYVDEIQNLVRIGNQSLPTQNQEINLNQFINHLIQPYLRITESKSIEIIVNTASNLPSSILANEKLLLQTMRSILDNAVNFTESGEIEIQVLLAERNTIRFVIRDSGNGISQEILSNIFEFSSWDAKSHQRSHLGLPISKVLVEKMGGKLHLISDNRNGTKVWMDLPLVIAKHANIDPLDYQDLNNIKVLIVDDNSTCRKVLELQTAELGMRYASANNGQTAIAMLRNEYQKNDPFDLLLLDHQMPNMTGVDLLQRIRDDHKVNKDIKTIILTGLDININDELLQKENINSVLNKPISSIQLRNQLLKAIEKEE